MNRRHLALLVLLALIWGSSFMFIKVAVRELAPATLIFGRIGLAAVALAIVVPAAMGTRATLAELRTHWRALVLVGLVNTALPFWLLSWGETRIDSGLASIIQASVPIFNALIAFGFFHDQRVTGRRLGGVAVGFVGVALLVGAQPHGRVLGALAVVGMAACYAAGGLFTRRHLATASPRVVALGTSAVAAVTAAPFGIAQAPGQVPSAKVLASVVVLGLDRHRLRLPAVLHDHRRSRGGVRLARHISGSAGGARVRRRLPRRGHRCDCADRARPDPGRCRARNCAAVRDAPTAGRRTVAEPS